MQTPYVVRFVCRETGRSGPARFVAALAGLPDTAAKVVHGGPRCRALCVASIVTVETRTPDAVREAARTAGLDPA